MKVMNGLVMTLEGDKRFFCIWLLYYVSNFANLQKKRCQHTCVSIKSYLIHEIIFFS